MPFDVTLQKAKDAFDFCHDKFLNTDPPSNLRVGERGTWETSVDGSGNWCRLGNSMYFNAGVADPNLEEGEIPNAPDTARLSQADMGQFEQWFQAKNLPQGQILRVGNKRNFTSVVNGRAFNFHLYLG